MAFTLPPNAAPRSPFALTLSRTDAHRNRPTAPRSSALRGESDRSHRTSTTAILWSLARRRSDTSPARVTRSPPAPIAPPHADPERRSPLVQGDTIPPGRLFRPAQDVPGSIRSLSSDHPSKSGAPSDRWPEPPDRIANETQVF